MTPNHLLYLIVSATHSYIYFKTLSHNDLFIPHFLKNSHMSIMRRFNNPKHCFHPIHCHYVTVVNQTDKTISDNQQKAMNTWLVESAKLPNITNIMISKTQPCSMLQNSNSCYHWSENFKNPTIAIISQNFILWSSSSPNFADNRIVLNRTMLIMLYISSFLSTSYQSMTLPITCTTMNFLLHKFLCAISKSMALLQESLDTSC